MPRVNKVSAISPEETEARRDYFDRHTPHVICETTCKRGQKMKVKVKMGNDYPHPDEVEHYIRYIQLWNLETMLAEVTFAPSTMGGEPSHAEVDFYISPKQSAYLTAMSLCTKHGLWQSEEVIVKVID